MSTFHELLVARIEQGGCSTEDALASVLPLARQVALVHASGKVAPLEGVSALQVEGSGIWFHESAAQEPTRNATKLQVLDKPATGVEILAESKRTLDVDSGLEQVANLRIATRDQEIKGPVYLPGYICWEHQVGHHDPVSDIFCLGMILASLACGLDFNQPGDIETFVASRRNLFRLNPQLHPVMAKAIVRMTELSRHNRPQDLSTIIHNLQHYRDQNVDFEFDLANAETVAKADSRKRVILSKLQERLFEISRRNRLLHFHSTLNAVNLTHASVPLSFDVRNIRPDQVLTWEGAFSKAISAGEAVSLNRYLNFSEQLYLPSVLDRIRTEALRDSAEFGFVHLRLAICFLRWANIKESPPEHFDSPLVMLPVRLIKKKGVRDSYWLHPLTTEAELNPVVRHLFKLLYDIHLPATVDLAESTLDELYRDLAAKITASEPGVTLNKVDRPRIELIHDLAKRRVDRYRRSARLSGRGIRSFLEIDYSYDPSNFHPLGLALFRAKVHPTPTHLREIVQDKPAPRNYMTEPAPEDATTAEKDKQFYALHEAADDNPYNWDFDLCRLTLGNFRYRKMSLVRDYTDLLGNEIPDPSFDAIFSLAPRTLEIGPAEMVPLEERFHIVQCDPTQAKAIDLARKGISYIVQGPPGTGKSQTITNLIADYVVRGKRVLFVCEKRAAIDVVYARLKQSGLHELCCLIHDSQTDKKEFILDLKATYDHLLSEQETKPRTWQVRRQNLIKALQEELAPLDAFNQAMLSKPAAAGVSVRRLLDRALELSACVPQLPPDVSSSLPGYSVWAGHAEAIEHLASAIREIQPDGVLARHPIRLLSVQVAQNDRPTQLISSGIRTAREHLQALTSAMKATGLPRSQWPTLESILTMAGYAAGVEFLARRKLLGLADERSALSGVLSRAIKECTAARQELSKAQEAAKHWTQKLPPDETRTALEQAKTLEGKFLSFLSPAWWRLRKVLASRYRFGAHAVRPSWTQVLGLLDAEYKAASALAEAERKGREALGTEETLESVSEGVSLARQEAAKLPPLLQPLHEGLLQSPQAAEIVEKLVALKTTAERLKSTCAEFLHGFGAKPLDELQGDLDCIDQSMDSLGSSLYCLGRLAELPPELAALFRSIPLDSRQLEAALAHQCVNELLKTDRVLNRFCGTVRDGHVERMSRLNRKWQDANASAVLEKARQAFLDHLRVSSLPAAQLTPEQKEFKGAYNRGRRELEHEFGKVMRHKSIRDLVAGDSGLIISDLKPVWLMSPLSVSDTLPLQTDAFDVVIFDEASQITLEAAVPSIFRSTQAIVVGDEMQLPPTDFFSAKAETQDDEEVLLSESGQVFEYDLSSNSFLNHAAKNLPSRMLGWHYRSRSESLVSFSNWAFYQGQLLTVPEQRLAAAGRGEILAQSPAEGHANVSRLLDRPMSFHFIKNGVYDNRRNRAEAEYVAHLIHGMLMGGHRHSIGVVAFSEAQQTEIESALAALASQDKPFSDRLDDEYEREVDGQYAGLLIKNLENIQGDERDVIILSVCYGHDPDGKMRMNFGPINQSGGEKRLNVAFSRAKQHMVVVSSILHSDITNEYNDGANCLKNYLKYAAACSAGDVTASQRVLRELAVWKENEEKETAVQDVVVCQVADALQGRGYAVDLGVGLSFFRCDVAARRHGEHEYRLGVLIDTEDHYQQKDLLEREMLRPQLLRAFGWRIVHVLASDWYQNREAVLDRLVKSLEQNEELPVVEADEDESEDAWNEFDGPVEPEVVPAPPDAASGQSKTAANVATGAPHPSHPSPAPAGAAQEARAASGPFKRYFEFMGGTSSKFWEVALADKTVTVRFGRIGTNGQTQQKVFIDEPTALRTAQRLIREKLGKGYIEKGA